jgi:hypothetical protein
MVSLNLPDISLCFVRRKELSRRELPQQELDARRDGWKGCISLISWRHFPKQRLNPSSIPSIRNIDFAEYSSDKA